MSKFVRLFIYSLCRACCRVRCSDLAVYSLGGACPIHWVGVWAVYVSAGGMAGSHLSFCLFFTRTHTHTQNIGLAIFPVIIAAIYESTDETYIPEVEIFFIALAILGTVDFFVTCWLLNVTHCLLFHLIVLNMCFLF